VGLMGLVSQAVHDGGRHVLGFVLSLLISFFVSVLWLIDQLNHSVDGL